MAAGRISTRKVSAPGMVNALGVDMAVTAMRAVSTREVSRREDLDPFVKGIV